MIQALVPLGLRAEENALRQEVATLAGPRQARGDGHAGIARWGASRPGGGARAQVRQSKLTRPSAIAMLKRTSYLLAEFLSLDPPA